MLFWQNLVLRPLLLLLDSLFCSAGQFKFDTSHRIQINIRNGNDLHTLCALAPKALRRGTATEMG